MMISLAFPERRLRLVSGKAQLVLRHILPLESALVAERNFARLLTSVSFISKASGASNHTFITRARRLLMESAAFLAFFGAIFARQESCYCLPEGSFCAPVCVGIRLKLCSC
jgi:hypothetical protein